MMTSRRPTQLNFLPISMGFTKPRYKPVLVFHKHGLNNYHMPSLVLGALGDAAIFLLTQEDKKIHHQLNYLTTAYERQHSDDILVMSTRGPEFPQ